MAVDLSDVVEALRSQLEDNVANFVLSFTPERSYADWDLKLEDANVLHVDVVLHSTECEAEVATRGDVQYQVVMDIGIRKRFGPAEEDAGKGRVAIEEIDTLVLLVAQIHEYLCVDRLTDYADASWKSTSLRAVYVPDHLKRLRQFTGIVRTTYEVVAPLA